MSALAKVLGSGAKRTHQFPFENEIYTLRPIDWDMKELLELHLYEEKVKAVGALRGRMDDTDYQFKLDTLTARYEAGEFALESEEGQRYYMGAASEPVTEEDTKLLSELEKTCRVLLTKEGELQVNPKPPDEVQKIIEAHKSGLATILENRKRQARALPGLLFFARTIFGCDKNTMLRMLKQRPMEVGQLISLVVRESMLTEAPDKPAENFDPNC